MATPEAMEILWAAWAAWSWRQGATQARAKWRHTKGPTSKKEDEDMDEEEEEVWAGG